MIELDIRFSPLDYNHLVVFNDFLRPKYEFGYLYPSAWTCHIRQIPTKQEWEG